MLLENGHVTVSGKIEKNVFLIAISCNLVKEKPMPYEGMCIYLKILKTSKKTVHNQLPFGINFLCFNLRIGKLRCFRD